MRQTCCSARVSSAQRGRGAPSDEQRRPTGRGRSEQRSCGPCARWERVCAKRRASQASPTAFSPGCLAAWSQRDSGRAKETSGSTREMRVEQVDFAGWGQRGSESLRGASRDRPWPSASGERVGRASSSSRSSYSRCCSSDGTADHRRTCRPHGRTSRIGPTSLWALARMDDWRFGRASRIRSRRSWRGHDGNGLIYGRGRARRSLRPSPSTSAVTVASRPRSVAVFVCRAPRCILCMLAIFCPLSEYAC